MRNPSIHDDFQSIVTSFAIGERTEEIRQVAERAVGCTDILPGDTWDEIKDEAIEAGVAESTYGAVAAWMLGQIPA